MVYVGGGCLVKMVPESTLNATWRYSRYKQYTILMLIFITVNKNLLLDDSGKVKGLERTVI